MSENQKHLSRKGRNAETDLDELDFEEYEPVRPAPQKTTSVQPVFWVNVIIAVLVAAGLLLSSLSFASLRSSNEELSKQVADLSDQIAAMNAPALAAQSSQTYISWTSNEPLLITQTSSDGTAVDSVDLKLLNVGTQPVLSVSASLSSDGLSALASELNQADPDYSYQAVMENSNLRLVVTPKDAESEESSYEFTGSTLSTSAYLLADGNGTGSLRITEPVLELINRCIALNMSSSVALPVTVTYKDLDGQETTKTLTLSLSNVDASLTNDTNAYGAAGYVLQATL